MLFWPFGALFLAILYGALGHVRGILDGFSPGFREGVGLGGSIEPPLKVGVLPMPAAAGLCVDNGGNPQVACQVAWSAVIANDQIAKRDNRGHVLHPVLLVDRFLLRVELLDEAAPAELFTTCSLL